MRVLVTGASGFVGSAILPALSKIHEVSAAARNKGSKLVRVQWVKSPNILASGNWTDILVGIDVIVHLAAVAHLPLRSSSSAKQHLIAVNAYGAADLARQAARSGVRRFIFMSSIKAAGDHSRGQALRPDMAPAPEDIYGRAKLLAEQLLLNISAETKLEMVILRPPMVYGPNSKGNFAMLVNCVRRGLPMPFGLVHNRRSLLSVWNLAEVVNRCIEADVAGRILHLADGIAISTKDLVHHIAQGLGTAPRLVSVPPSIIRVGLTLVGRRALARRLLDSLEVDGRLANALLGWQPEWSTKEGVIRAIQDSR